MNIILVISNNCDACTRAVEQLEKIQEAKPQINAKIIDRNLFEDKRISITPALIVNNELFSYGDIDEEKLLAKVH